MVAAGAFGSVSMSPPCITVYDCYNNESEGEHEKDTNNRGNSRLPFNIISYLRCDLFISDDSSAGNMDELNPDRSSIINTSGCTIPVI